MNININIPIRLVVRATRALERLAEDFADVHRVELTAARTTPPADDRGKVWVQSDQAVYQAELIEKSVGPHGEDFSFQ